ncbi:MAG: glucan biosynthesis protein, partial [Pseudomonadota bacterium]
ADLEALYHRRPGLWIEPRDDWGSGSVTLVEIPTDREIYDNIVAYWRPSADMLPGQPQTFRYGMTWGGNPEPERGLLKVLNTRMGGRPEGGLIIAIDFADGPDVPEDLGTLMKLIRTSAGEVSTGVVQRNPETGGPRLAFTFKPGDAELAEFRVQLRKADGPALSEVWLYRWTA